MILYYSTLYALRYTTLCVRITILLCTMLFYTLYIITPFSFFGCYKLCQLENVEWASKSLRVWLSLEVISDAKSGASGGKASGLQQQQQQQPEDLLLDGGKGVPTQRAGPGSAEGAGEGQRSSKAGWCVLARVQGTVIDVPADGVERRFTSFFSKVVLRLDSKAFPGVATVEVREDQGKGRRVVDVSPFPTVVR